MNEVRLLAAENGVKRRKAGRLQTWMVLIDVANLGYHKDVEIFWAGENSEWHTLRAHFQARRGHDREVWRARLSVSDRGGRPLPGDIRFAIRLRCDGHEYWDNNLGRDYLSHADSGWTLRRDLQVLTLNPINAIKDGQSSADITIATTSDARASKVIVHWTKDQWRHQHVTHCRRQKSRKGAWLWTANLPVDDAFAIEYYIECKTPTGPIWDNNLGYNFRLSRPPLRIMILNLHCYQESHQDLKFSLIAKAIDEQQTDIVCLQEVAEHWNQGHGDWSSNSANIINQRLKAPMHLYFDWSHLGFDRYREGVAILSRFPLQDSESRYVSDSHDIYSIHSRKVVMSCIRVPYIGTINVFSAHLSWWEDGFESQFHRLCDWAGQRATEDTQATLLCGDFNIAAGSAGYRAVVDGSDYQDQYLAANHQGLFEKIFRVNDPHWGKLLADDYRIDYIFMNRDAKLAVTSARVLFTANDYGPVSDHCGYLMSFEPK